MTFFGCLPLLLLVIGFALLASVLRLAGNVLETVGATAVWLYESLLNVFRTHKKEVINPFTGHSNFSARHTRQDKDLKYTPTERRPKRYEASDGDYIDYTEL